MNNLSFIEKIYIQNVNSTQDVSLLKDIYFSSLNCNSINISTYNVGKASINKFKLKINAMLKTKPDILFVQDIRLNDSLISSCRMCTQFPECFLILAQYLLLATNLQTSLKKIKI